MRNKENKKRNLGIELLRMFLCFRIILHHYYSSYNKYMLQMKNNTFQVSCFFFISFYYLFPIISNRDTKRLKQRLERLLIPYTIHPIINLILNNIIFLVFKINRYNRYLSLNDLKIQLIVGRGIYDVSVLWFIFNLMFFTLFFFIFAYIFKSRYLFLLQVLAIISYEFQYSGINFFFFVKYSKNIYMSVGNLIETFPISVFSLSLSSIKFHEILLNHRKKILLFSLLFLYQLSNYNIFFDVRGFSSKGIKNIFISLFLFSFFSVIPFDNVYSGLLLIITQFTKYTQGIYCLHVFFIYYFWLLFEKKGTLFGCFILYILSYFISFIGYNICSKTKLKFLFI